MQFKGIDLDSLGEQFPQGKGNGKTLVLDGDFGAYAAAATVKKLDTAVRHWLTDVLTYQFLTGAEFVEVHLTASGCRKKDRALYPTVKEYQSNRNGKSKPPLLEALREHLPHATSIPDSISVHLHRYHEADDVIVSNALRLKDKGIICSMDKDMRIAPAPYWDNDTQRLWLLEEGDTYGWIKRKYTEAGHLKIDGHGRAVLMLQWLAGDSADAVAGLTRLEGKRCGISTAIDFLEGCAGESEAANKILWAYARNKQNALAELEMVYLSTTERAYDYLCTLDIEPKLRKWIDGLNEYNLKYMDRFRNRTATERATQD